MDFGRIELGSDPEVESDPGLELSLGLSLGRSFSKPREAVAVAQEPPQRRRQQLAIRRQREKKQRKAAEAVRRASSMDDRAVQEARARWRAREREAREQDPRFAAVSRLLYAPAANGFGFPYVMPCWAPAGSPAARADCRQPETNPFPPAPPNADGGAASSASDSRSGSQRGSISSTSSERRSSATQNLVDKVPLASARKVCNLTTACCQSVRENADELLSNASRGSNATVTTASVPGRLEGAASVNKPVSPGTNDRQDEPPMPRMPCVSTTGDGPNGKTITGFLYRYNKSEVSIVCVCHGSSFSPTNFIRHAGGTDVSHPLRQIVVVSS